MLSFWSKLVLFFSLLKRVVISNLEKRHQTSPLKKQTNKQSYGNMDLTKAWMKRRFVAETNPHGFK